MICVGINVGIAIYSFIRFICYINQTFKYYRYALMEEAWQALPIYIGNQKAGKKIGTWKENGEFLTGEIKILFDDRSPGNFKYFIRIGTENGGVFVRNEVVEKNLD